MPSVRLTDRDQEILRWIAQVPCASAPQVGRRFGMAYRNVSRRLKQLAQAGYLSHERLFHGRPGVYLATLEGSAIVGLAPARRELDVRTFNHDLAVVDLLIDLELAGDEIRTGRADAEDGGRISASRAPFNVAGSQRHPDFVVTLKGTRWPGELRTADADSDLEPLLAAYADAGVAGVILWTASREMAERAGALAQDLGLVVDVRQWQPHVDASDDPWAVPS